MRRFLVCFATAALIWSAIVAAACAQPALDSGFVCASNICFNNVTSGTTVTVSATTVQSPDLIEVGITGGTNVAGGTPITFTVTGCTLSWTRYTRQAGLTFDNHTMTLEVWTAPAATALTACTITATADRTIDAATIGYFAATGLHSTAAPFDGNGALPQLNQNLTGSSILVQGTITTTQAHDMIVGFWSGNDANCATWPGGVNTGTTIGGIHNFGALVWSCLGIGVWPVTTTQSATGWNTQQNHNSWYFPIHALTADAPSVTGHSRLIQ